MATAPTPSTSWVIPNVFIINRNIIPIDGDLNYQRGNYKNIWGYVF